MKLEMKYAIVDTPPAKCPACHAIMKTTSMYSAVGTRGPHGGDVSICTECFVFMVFLDDLQLRLLSDAEWMAMPAPQRAFLSGMRDRVRVVKPMIERGEKLPNA